MKIRSGFVSNSSSSSFIIAFDKVPTCSYDVLHAMFPDDKSLREGVSYDCLGETDVDSVTAATLVWKQIDGQKPMTKSQISESVGSGFFEGRPDYFAHDSAREVGREYALLTKKSIYDKDVDPEWKKKHEAALKADRSAYEKERKAALVSLIDREYPKFKGKKCFEVSFSDNDGDVFTAMENGDAFRNISFIRISHH